MTQISKIKKDIRELRGATVSIFGQATTLNGGVDKLDADVLDILDELEGYEVDGVQTIEDMEEYEPLTEIRGDNSYNYNGHISNDINWYIYKGDFSGKTYIELKVHRYGDVRGNYTEDVILEIDEDIFYEILYTSGRYGVVLDKYEYNTTPLNEDIEIYNEDGNYLTTLYCCEYDELEDELKAYLKEQN